MHVVDYYREAGFEVTKTEPNCYYGPCPECGGRDRFIIFKKTRRRSKCPELGGFSCNRGCKIGGDVISFLLKFCGKTYPQALEECGVSNDYQPDNRYSKRRRNPPKRQASLCDNKWTIQAEQHAAHVEDPKAWQEHAEKFVLACHEAILDRQKSLDYLAARGVTDDLVQRFRIGFNAGQVSKPKGQYQPAYKQAAAWGMPNLRRPKDNSLQKTIALQAGLTIPCYQSYGDTGPTGSLLRINIRPFYDDYRIVKGSQHFLQAQIIINPGQDVALVVESEFDGIALSKILPDVTIICMGSAGGRPGKAANMELRHKQLILLCLDRDRSTDKDIAAHCKKYPDSPALVWALGAGVDRHPDEWFVNYPQCQPWYCPAGNFWLPENERTFGSVHGLPIKDPGDAITVGCDMAAWFAEGVALYSLVVPKAIFVSPDVGVSKGEGVSESENLLAFAVFWPEHAERLLSIAEKIPDVFSVCRSMIDRGIYTEGLLDATAGDLRDKIERILIAGADCWDWSADPDAYLGRITKPSPPASPEWAWLIDYLVLRQIDIKVIEGEVSLVFTRALGSSGDGELERVSAALGLDEVGWYLGAAKNGVWRAEVFR